MAAESSTLLIIHFLSHKGKRLLGQKWQPFRQSLRTMLQERGILDESSSSELLLYAYSHPYVALSSLFEGLERARQEFGWDKGRLPLQIVLHQQEDKEMSGFEDPAASSWDLLHPETVYVTLALKHQWEQLMATRKLPSHSFSKEGTGVFELKLADRASVRSETLFPHRELALLGKHKECFYCGRHSHKPAACPSKMLTMETMGLPEAGYLSFEELAAGYKEAFAEQEHLAQLAAAGLSAAQIRENRNLQAFLAYFDLFSLYQLRFLHFLAFAPCTKWHELRKTKQTEIDSRNLHLGLDCLRVGQYGKAEEFFEEGRMRREGKLFCARVAQAFRSLEQGREKDMGTLLESALNQAGQEKERVYIHLLLNRYYMLQGDLWKADQISNHATTLFDEPEIAYSRIQVLVREDFGEKAFTQLQQLTKRHRKLFLAALMDPSLLPIHGLVENMLAAHLDALLQNARANLGEAKVACEELQTWLEPGDQVLQANLTVLANLEKQLERGFYFDLLDVAQKSGVLTANCQRLWNERIDQLHDRIDELATQRYNYYIFWTNYPLKPLFSRFIKTLSAVRAKTDAARALLKQASGTAYHAASGHHQESEQLLAGLKPLFTRMIWCKEILHGIFVFGKKLLLAELALGPAAGALVYLLPLFMGDGLGENLRALLADPWFQKQSLMVTAALAAPTLALALTFLDIKKTN